MNHYRLFYPRQTCILSVQHEGKSNATIVDWVTPASVKPPMVAVALNSKSYSLELLGSSKSFVLSILPEAMMEKAMAIGSATGRMIDKVDEYQLTLKPAKTVKAPLVDGALAWVECEVEGMFNAGDHVVVLGEVRETHFPDEDSSRQAILFNWGNKNYFGMRREMAGIEGEKRNGKEDGRKEENRKDEKKDEKSSNKDEIKPVLKEETQISKDAPKDSPKTGDKK